MFHMLDTDGTTVRTAKHIYIDTDSPSDGRVKRVYALDTDGTTVREVFRGLKLFEIDGASATVGSNAREIVDFGLDSDFATQSGGSASYIDYTFSASNISAALLFSWRLHPSIRPTDGELLDNYVEVSGFNAITNTNALIDRMVLDWNGLLQNVSTSRTWGTASRPSLIMFYVSQHTLPTVPHGNTD